MIIVDDVKHTNIQSVAKYIAQQMNIEKYPQMVSNIETEIQSKLNDFNKGNFDNSDFECNKIYGCYIQFA